MQISISLSKWISPTLTALWQISQLWNKKRQYVVLGLWFTPTNHEERKNITEKNKTLKLVIEVCILKLPWYSPLKFAFISIVSQMIKSIGNLTSKGFTILWERLCQWKLVTNSYSFHTHLRPTPISTPSSRTRAECSIPHSSPRQGSKQQLSSSSPHLTSQAHWHHWT